jgi:predicted Zn-dependent protease
MITLFTARSRRRWLYPLISLLLAVGLCLGQPTVTHAISWIDLIRRGIQVIQLSSLSDQQEVRLGQQINDELIGKQVRLYRGDRQLIRYVDEIGQRLAAASTRPSLPYQFQIVDDNAINAFATMGGFVYIHTGLLKAADNEAQLASVVAHEIGHIAARHSVKQMRQLALAGGVATAAGLDRNLAVSIGVDLALRRPNSRAAEFEADQLGLTMMGRSSYAQSAMPAFMRKLIQARSLPTFLSTHPATADRIERMEQLIDPNLADGDGLDNAAYRARVRSVS